MTAFLPWAAVPSPAADPSFFDIYATAMRNSLFTGFLTLGSFLLAAKTLLVIQFRKDVYERKEYYDAHREQERKGKVFDPLRRLANFLNANVLLALASSALQFSVGFIPAWWSAAVCIALPAITLVFTAASVVRVRRNLNTMFDWLNSTADAYLASTSKPCPAEPPPG